jgi:hypothetical protein
MEELTNATTPGLSEPKGLVPQTKGSTGCSVAVGLFVSRSRKDKVESECRLKGLVDV